MFKFDNKNTVLVQKKKNFFGRNSEIHLHVSESEHDSYVIFIL